MEIILKEDVKNLGNTYQIVKVKSGYARNYLIPKNLAVIASESNKKVFAEVQKQKASKEEKIKTAAIEFSEKLKTISVKIATKVAPSGKIYGSINNIQLADAIKKQHNFEVDRKKITIDNEENIKEIGSYTAKITLHRDVLVDINFEVVAE
ncbi:MAG: 50S ribosomal protein L9 [Bacteroidetes bacterium GWE2_29_8]|nr:MAG: 50S ribosomal protein L9 [Bacteroidetes bacterium GWE2_29_8]OFY24848.1 MAG: 50S ribosomal protein L9 [Bacteroidetes bacterium GWF2_29_10]